jgi:hypothetical protein
VSAWKILATDNNASPENLIPDHPNRSISKHQHECNGGEPDLRQFAAARVLRFSLSVAFDDPQHKQRASNFQQEDPKRMQSW